MRDCSDNKCINCGTPIEIEANHCNVGIPTVKFLCTGDFPSFDKYGYQFTEFIDRNCNTEPNFVTVYSGKCEDTSSLGGIRKYCDSIQKKALTKLYVPKTNCSREVETTLSYDINKCLLHRSGSEMVTRCN